MAFFCCNLGFHSIQLRSEQLSSSFSWRWVGRRRNRSFLGRETQNVRNWQQPAEGKNGKAVEDQEGKRNVGSGSKLGVKWLELLLDREPDNVVAVGLTGVLAWASIQILWQLFSISFAILLAALKYSFIAALLIFMLIALL